jgi:hypothetical protein
MSRVFVYENRHKTRQNRGRKVYSIKAVDGPNKGRVIGHSSKVLLRDVTPKVSQAGRERVLREGRKNVHAGLVGTLAHTDLIPFHGERITYNPHKYDTFVFAAWDQVHYYGSELAYLDESGVKVLECKDNING